MIEENRKRKTLIVRRGINGLLLCMAIGLLGGLLALSPYAVDFERTIGLDWLFNMRGKIKPPAEAIVIANDGFTGENLGIPSLPREWPRTIHAELVDALTRLGVSVIVFDIDFRKQRSAVDDQVFAKAVKRSGRVVLLQELKGKGKPLKDKTGKVRGNVWVEELLSPVAVLTDAARG